MLIKKIRKQHPTCYQIRSDSESLFGEKKTKRNYLLGESQMLLL